MKALLQYVLLVGLPILGVLGVLQLGEALVAPKAVAGIWRLESARGPAPVSSCPDRAEVADVEAFTLSQSGPKLTFELGKLTAYGAIDGRAVQATSPTLFLDARVTDSRMLRGTMNFPACPDAPPLAFTASQEDAS